MKLKGLLLMIGYIPVFLLWTGSLIAQDCDICSHPRLVLYDAQMPPRPSTADSIVTWWTLQWPMKVARAALHNEDPTRDCITWYDGALVNARDLQGDTLRIGLEYFNYPPAGEVNADYLLTGSITGSGGTYYLNLTLETAVSREVVRTQSVAFGSDITSQQTAGENAAAALMSLLQKIRTFEVNKRNTDVTVAMRDRESAPQPITITPKKKKINTDESVDVDIEMIDCDGVPLGDRDISFIETTVYDIPFSGSTGGTVEPSTVTTDANGKATVKFTAGSTTGIGQIVASYPHRKPCGRASGFMRSAAVIIGEPPVHRWLVQATISEKIDRYIDTVWSNGYRHITDQQEGTASITAIVKNESTDSLGFFFVCYEGEGDTFEDGVAVSGNWNKSYFLNSYAKCFSTPETATRFEGYSGNVSPGETGLEFHYPVDDYVINAQCGGTAQGSYSAKYTHCAEPHSDQSSGSSSTSFGIGAEFNEDQCSITKTDVSYTVQGSRTSVVYHSGGEKTTRTRSLNATIEMIDAPTGVEQERGQIPASYCLEQNYPNPFNPSTMIGYQIPVASYVSLKIYDILGREVANLVDMRKEAGSYSTTFNAGEKFTSGVYIARLVAQSYGKYQGNKSFVQAKKILMVK